MGARFLLLCFFVVGTAHATPADRCLSIIEQFLELPRPTKAFTGLYDDNVILRTTKETFEVVDMASDTVPFYADGRITKDGDLVLNFTLRQKNQRSPNLRGKQVFDAMMVHFESRMKAIQGNWTSGDNLEAFNTFTAAGLNPEDAARNTWTGQQAGRYGYTEVVIDKKLGEPGKYTDVRVHFSKARTTTD